MIIIMFGAPGAGKGTQGTRIAEEYHLPEISTGDIFRKNMRENTPLGVLARSYIDDGNLVPDDVTIEMVVERVHEKDCENGYILDGFPRNLYQAEQLKKRLAERGKKVDVVLDIVVPDAVITERNAGRRVCPKCGCSYHIVHFKPRKTGICDVCGAELVTRKDDRPETVQKRLFVYHESTEPLADFYKKEGILKTVDGNRDMEEVFEDVRKLLEDIKCQ